VLGAPWKAQPLGVNRLREAALLTAGLLVASYWCFVDATAISDPSFYAPVPFLFWAAVRFGMLGATGAVAIITAFITYSALVETGPFANLSPTETAFALQTYLLVRSVPLYLLATSIEQRRNVESSLLESEQRFRSLADSAPVLLWMTGPDKLCTFVNQGWLKLTGRTLEQELGTGWIESLHPDDRQHCLEIWEVAFDAKQPFEVEHRVRRHDGEYRWALLRGIPRLAENGEFLGYIGSVLDITDRKGVEESNRALAHVQRLAIMGELTAAVAPELRQPSAAIMSNAEAALVLLESGEVPSDEVREIVTDIKHANLRANEVLGRIQDFLRKREARIEMIDLNTVVSEVLLLVDGDARKRRIKIFTELSEDLPRVLGNRTQLQQVLINLLINGMDAMSSTLDDRRYLVIETSKPDGDGCVEVAVSDSGSGIASSNMPRLFESFFTTRAEGMGLGLSIARSIVESHGGHIWADNNPEGGATFHFTVETAANRMADPSEKKASAMSG
jgi:two-component system sensor kinase FixL